MAVVWMRSMTVALMWRQSKSFTCRENQRLGFFFLNHVIKNHHSDKLTLNLEEFDARVRVTFIWKKNTPLWWTPCSEGTSTYPRSWVHVSVKQFKLRVISGKLMQWRKVRNIECGIGSVVFTFFLFVFGEEKKQVMRTMRHISSFRYNANSN